MNNASASSAATTATALDVPTALSIHERLVRLLASFTAATHRLEAIDLRFASIQVESARPLLGEISALQSEVNHAEAAIRELIAQHPEIFPGESKSVKTAVGTVAKRNTQRLVMDDEALVIQRMTPTEKRRFVKTEEKVMLEILERETPETLKRLGVTPLEDVSITITAAKANLEASRKKVAKLNGATSPHGAN